MQEPVILMLSARQANLLLSSMWTQALSPENAPRNYEAISHTYSLMLLFSESKVRERITRLYVQLSVLFSVFWFVTTLQFTNK